MGRNAEFSSKYRVSGSEETYAHSIECMGCRSQFAISLFQVSSEDGEFDSTDYVHPFAYCPVCGGAFSGRLNSRPTWCPAWAWNRFRDGDDIRDDIRDKLWSKPSPGPATGDMAWEIQDRVRFMNQSGEWSEWREWAPCQSPRFLGSARDVRRVLTERRENPDSDKTYCQVEFRAIVSHRGR